MDTSLGKKIPNGRWLHIIPPAMLVYIVAFMDRTNIGFAIANYTVLTWGCRGRCMASDINNFESLVSQ